MIRQKRTSNINFIMYLMGRMISDTGTSIQMMVMPLYIIDVGGSATSIGLFTFVSLVPALMMYPFAGVLGDRINRKTIMVVTDFISAGVVLGVACISYFDRMSITLLLLAQVIISLLNGIFDPATRGMLPKLVPENELTQANSKLASLRSVSVFLGPVIGAVLYAKLGITVLFLINGISFLLSGTSEMLIKYEHVKRESKLRLAGIITDLSKGIRFIQNNKMIRQLCYFFLMMYMLIQPIFAVALPLFFKTRLAYSDIQYGYLQSISILGMLLGSLLTGLLFGEESNILKSLKVGCSLLVVSILVFSVLMFPDILAIFGNASSIYFILLSIDFCLFSAAHMFINVPVQSFIQAETPEEYISRVFSIVGMITRGGIPFGALVYGVVLERVEIHLTVLMGALLMMIISVVFLTSPIKFHHD